MKYLSLYVALFLSTSLLAQAPGYLGKRYYLQADCAGMVSAGPTANNRGIVNYFGENGGGFALDTRFGLQAGYALSRMQLVSAGVNYLKTGLETQAYTRAVNFPGENSGRDYHELFYNLNGWTADVAYRRCKTEKGGLAPLGVFRSHHLQPTFLSGEIVDKRTSYQNRSGPAIHGKLGYEPKFIYWSYGWETGQTWVVKDKILLSLAIQINIPLSLSRTIETLDEPYYSVDSFESFEAYNLEVFRQEAFSRMFWSSIFNFRVGAGYLLF